MLKPRIIPCLLIRNNGLVKTVNFKNERYIGDPINAVKIFNEKQVDEIIIIDIDSSSKNKAINFDLIEKLALECRMPLCYVGGIKSVKDAEKILSLGVEKIGISSGYFEDKNLVSEISKSIGSQSIAVVLDVKKNLIGKREVYIHNGTKKIKTNIENTIKEIQELGAGEIIINDIDREGTMKGFDIEFLQKIRENSSIPLTFMGGAGTLNHIKDLISAFNIIGVAAGSLFVFKGKYKAVLINYPNEYEKKSLFK